MSVGETAFNIFVIVLFLGRISAYWLRPTTICVSLLLNVMPEHAQECKKNTYVNQNTFAYAILFHWFPVVTTMPIVRQPTFGNQTRRLHN